jgi:3D (Asp-Asp-Asp) domain-containing protein
LEPCPDGYEYWKTVIAKVTAYEPSERCCPGTADGKTSIGHNAWKLDGCAVDPRAIPYGTMLYVPNVGYREADDTGSAMKRSWNRNRTFHVDVRMTYFSEARNWGVKYLPVKLFVKKRAQ